ncbi:MAG: signal peptide peptidase SppA, partial [Deltaproteobacteria bacterium]
MKTKSRVLIVAIPIVFLIAVALLGFFVARMTKTKHAILLPRGKKIGIIKVVGVIRRSDILIKQIKDFRDDTGIGGVILRINSPGGGVAPSQEIYEEVRKLSAQKPVFVSMGSVCASGGYYIAAASRTIFANPGTVTGSIGVIVGFSNLNELFKKIGIKSYIIKSGKFKDIGYPTREMTPEDLKVLQSVVNSIYEQFVQAVAKGRHLPIEKVKALADGRVFSGVQAKKLGLVDKIGNLEDTISLMARRLGIRGKPALVYAKNPREKLWELFFKSAVGKWVQPLLAPTHISPFYYLWPLNAT